MNEMKIKNSAAQDFVTEVQGKYKTILADPPWRFMNSTGKVAPEHKRLSRYPTLSLQEILDIPVNSIADENCHLYLWVPNALLAEGLETMRKWGFTYKTNVIWYKIRKDGGPDGRGVGFYFRNVTELVLFGIKGKMRTLKPGRTQVNIMSTRKREHSKKPDELYNIIEKCSSGPYLEMFARGNRKGWSVWGNQAEEYKPNWSTYNYNSAATHSNQLVLLEKKNLYSRNKTNAK